MEMEHIHRGGTKDINPQQLVNLKKITEHSFYFTEKKKYFFSMEQYEFSPLHNMRYRKRSVIIRSFLQLF